jgi:hypothetical protein
MMTGLPIGGPGRSEKAVSRGSYIYKFSQNLGKEQNGSLPRVGT